MATRRRHLRALGCALALTAGLVGPASLAGAQQIEGTRHGERLLGTDRHDFLWGRGRDDRLFGGGGVDFLMVSDGNDLVSGGDLSDGILAFGGNDVVTGGDGGDWIMLGWGKDRMNAGNGRDLVFVQNDHRADTVRCGRGRDLVITFNGRDVQDSYVGCESVRPNDEFDAAMRSFPMPQWAFKDPNAYYGDLLHHHDIDIWKR